MSATTTEIEALKAEIHSLKTQIERNKNRINTLRTLIENRDEAIKKAVRALKVIDTNKI